MKPGAAARLARPVRSTAATLVPSRPEGGRRGLSGSPRRLRRVDRQRAPLEVRS